MTRQMARHESMFPGVLILLAVLLLAGAAFGQAPPDPSQPRLELVGSDSFALGAIYVIFEPIQVRINLEDLPPVTVQLPQDTAPGAPSPNISGTGSIGSAGKGTGTVAMAAGPSLIFPSSGADAMPRIITPADVLAELEQLRAELQR